MRFAHFALAGMAMLLAAALTTAPARAQSGQGDDGGVHAVYVSSTPEAYAAMQQLPADEPLYLLNLIRFRNKAEYAEDSEFASNGWTGEQAYTEYSRVSTPIAERFGGKVIFAGAPQLMLIGPVHEDWDVAFIVAYPDAASFLSFVGNPQYREHAFHRSAAVADSRLIRMAALPVPE